MGFVPSVGRFLPVNNISAFVRRTGVPREGFSDLPPPGFGILPKFSHEWLVAGLLVVALAAVTMIAATVLFERRDVA